MSVTLFTSRLCQVLSENQAFWLRVHCHVQFWNILFKKFLVITTLCLLNLNYSVYIQQNMYKNLYNWVFQFRSIRCAYLKKSCAEKTLKSLGKGGGALNLDHDLLQRLAAQVGHLGIVRRVTDRQEQCQLLRVGPTKEGPQGGATIQGCARQRHQAGILEWKKLTVMSSNNYKTDYNIKKFKVLLWMITEIRER